MMGQVPPDELLRLEGARHAAVDGLENDRPRHPGRLELLLAEHVVHVVDDTLQLHVVLVVGARREGGGRLGVGPATAVQGRHLMAVLRHRRAIRAGRAGRREVIGFAAAAGAAPAAEGGALIAGEVLSEN